MAQTVKNLPAMQETRVQSLGREDPLEKGTEPTSAFLPGEFHGHTCPQECRMLDVLSEMHLSFVPLTQNVRCRSVEVAVKEKKP